MAECEAPSVASTAPGSAAPGGSVLKRIRLASVGEVGDAHISSNRLDVLAETLRKHHVDGTSMFSGGILRDGGIDFVVTRCEPAEGTLGPDTDYHLEDSHVVKFEKIEFSAWGEAELPTERLFSDYLAPQFKGECTAFGPACRRTRLFYCGQTFSIGDINFQVEATQPAGLGVLTGKTDIFAVWDHTPVFEKVQILPLHDALPRLDAFHDYLEPYLSAHKHKTFTPNEVFCYRGVQFKLVAAIPNVPARITSRTTIHCEGALHPSGNLLPLSQVALLPASLRALMLCTGPTTRDMESVIVRRCGLFKETLRQIQRISWPPADARESSQQVCKVCLVRFAIGDRCRRLPCRHIFHEGCVDTWLRRCTDCPTCKANVDRAIRDY